MVFHSGKYKILKKKSRNIIAVGRDQKKKTYQEREGIGELTESRGSQ